MGCRDTPHPALERVITGQRDKKAIQLRAGKASRTERHREFRTSAVSLRIATSTQF
jgi:hypothetical protein